MRKLSLVLLVFAFLASVSLFGCATSRPGQTTGAAEASANLAGKDGYVRLTADQWEQLRPQFEGSAAKSTPAKACRVVNCRRICIPGCDPPDSNGTIRGCSSCYSWYYECDLVCD